MKYNVKENADFIADNKFAPVHSDGDNPGFGSGVVEDGEED